MTDLLSPADVQRLLADPSADTRVEMAAKVALEFKRGALTPQERRIAEEIVRVMTRDAVMRVREALAEHLKDSPHLPRDAALTLARDVDKVAVLVLQHSQVLSDEDLITLMQNASSAKLKAIARRATISGPVSQALVASDDSTAIAALMDNAGAAIPEPALHAVLTRHGGNADIDESIARREQLPIGILERLVAAASDRLHQILIQRHDLPDRIASDLVFQIRERATVGLLTPVSLEAETGELVAHLKSVGRLTPSIMLRALCVGDLAFVEAAFAALGRVPVHNARALMHDAGPLGLKSLYDHLGLPKAMFRAFRVALEVARATPHDGGELDRERRRRRIIERILTQFEDVGTENLDYLLERLQASAEVQAASAA